MVQCFNGTAAAANTYAEPELSCAAGWCHRNRWGLVITLSKRYGLVGNPAAPTSMQVRAGMCCLHITSLTVTEACLQL
jgi:hypothetical protein